MKATRSILRRLELKIHHAITAEQMKKNVLSESAGKPGLSKPSQGDEPMKQGC
jgi:hypothetical protein